MLDLSGDWSLIDDPIAVSYQAKTAESAWAEAVTVEYAQRTAITKADATTDPGLLQTDSTVLHVWAAKLATQSGAIVPKIGDRWGHGGRSWVVRRVEEMDRDANGVQRYRLTSARRIGS